MHLILLLLLLPPLVSSKGGNLPTPPAPSNLRTHFYPPNTVAYSVPVERGEVGLTWINNAPADVRDITQSAFEIEVQNNHGALVWASGRVQSDEQQVFINISLQYETEYAWHVRTFLMVNGTGALDPTPWSSLLAFETGPAPDSWQQRGVEWIGGFGQLRSDFNLANSMSILRARAYVSGVGAYYIYINGQRVGDHVMDPPQTVYPKRILFNTFDVTSLLHAGSNAVGAILGNYKWGYTDIWCNMTTAGGPNGCRALSLQIVVEAADGTRSVHTTNTAQWRGRTGPIVWDHLFHGETFDARQQLEGWASHPLSFWPVGTWQPSVSMYPPTVLEGGNEIWIL